MEGIYVHIICFNDIICANCELCNRLNTKLYDIYINYTSLLDYASKQYWLLVILRIPNIFLSVAYSNVDGKVTVDAVIKTLTDEDPFDDPAPVKATIDKAVKKVVADSRIGRYAIESDGSYSVQTPVAGTRKLCVNSYLVYVFSI